MSSHLTEHHPELSYLAKHLTLSFMFYLSALAEFESELECTVRYEKSKTIDILISVYFSPA